MKIILEIACFIYCAAFLFVAGGAVGYHMAKKESYHKGHATPCSVLVSRDIIGSVIDD